MSSDEELLPNKFYVKLIPIRRDSVNQVGSSIINDTLFVKRKIGFRHDIRYVLLGKMNRYVKNISFLKDELENPASVKMSQPSTKTYSRKSLDKTTAPNIHQKSNSPSVPVQCTDGATCLDTSALTDGANAETNTTLKNPINVLVNPNNSINLNSVSPLNLTTPVSLGNPSPSPEKVFIEKKMMWALKKRTYKPNLSRSRSSSLSDSDSKPDSSSSLEAVRTIGNSDGTVSEQINQVVMSESKAQRIESKVEEHRLIIGGESNQSVEIEESRIRIPDGITPLGNRVIESFNFRSDEKINLKSEESLGEQTGVAKNSTTAAEMSNSLGSVIQNLSTEQNKVSQPDQNAIDSDKSIQQHINDLLNKSDQTLKCINKVLVKTEIGKSNFKLLTLAASNEKKYKKGFTQNKFGQNKSGGEVKKRSSTRNENQDSSTTFPSLKDVYEIGGEQDLQNDGGLSNDISEKYIIIAAENCVLQENTDEIVEDIPVLNVAGKNPKTYLKRKSFPAATKTPTRISKENDTIFVKTMANNKFKFSATPILKKGTKPDGKSGKTKSVKWAEPICEETILNPPEKKCKKRKNLSSWKGDVKESKSSEGSVLDLPPVKSVDASPSLAKPSVSLPSTSEKSNPHPNLSESTNPSSLVAATFSKNSKSSNLCPISSKSEDSPSTSKSLNLTIASTSATVNSSSNTSEVAHIGSCRDLNKSENFNLSPNISPSYGKTVINKVENFETSDASNVALNLSKSADDPNLITMGSDNKSESAKLAERVEDGRLNISISEIINKTLDNSSKTQGDSFAQLYAEKLDNLEKDRIQPRNVDDYVEIVKEYTVQEEIPKDIEIKEEPLDQGYGFAKFADDVKSPDAPVVTDMKVKIQEEVDINSMIESTAKTNPMIESSAVMNSTLESTAITNSMIESTSKRGKKCNEIKPKRVLLKNLPWPGFTCFYCSVKLKHKPSLLRHLFNLHYAEIGVKRRRKKMKNGCIIKKKPLPTPEKTKETQKINEEPLLTREKTLEIQRKIAAQIQANMEKCSTVETSTGVQSQSSQEDTTTKSSTNKVSKSYSMPKQRKSPVKKDKIENVSESICRSIINADNGSYEGNEHNAGNSKGNKTVVLSQSAANSRFKLVPKRKNTSVNPTENNKTSSNKKSKLESWKVESIVSGLCQNIIDTKTTQICSNNIKLSFRQQPVKVEPKEEEKIKMGCIRCQEVFYTEASLRRHIEEFHETLVRGRGLPCSFCFSVVDNLYSHVKQNHYNDKKEIKIAPFSLFGLPD